MWALWAPHVAVSEPLLCIFDPVEVDHSLQLCFSLWGTDTLPSVFLRYERYRCVVWGRGKAFRCGWYKMWLVQRGRLCFRSFRPAAGCQTYIHFCPVSQPISSPYVTVNAYRDTAPCLWLHICAVKEEDEAVCLPVMCSKLGSYFTPAGIYSCFPPSRQILRCFVVYGSLENSVERKKQSTQGLRKRQVRFMMHQQMLFRCVSIQLSVE